MCAVRLVLLLSTVLFLAGLQRMAGTVSVLGVAKDGAAAAGAGTDPLIGASFALEIDRSGASLTRAVGKGLSLELDLLELRTAGGTVRYTPTHVETSVGQTRWIQLAEERRLSVLHNEKEVLQLQQAPDTGSHSLVLDGLGVFEDVLLDHALGREMLVQLCAADRTITGAGGVEACAEITSDRQMSVQHSLDYASKLLRALAEEVVWTKGNSGTGASSGSRASSTAPAPAAIDEQAVRALVSTEIEGSISQLKTEVVANNQLVQRQLDKLERTSTAWASSLATKTELDNTETRVMKQLESEVAKRASALSSMLDELENSFNALNATVVPLVESLLVAEEKVVDPMMQTLNSTLLELQNNSTVVFAEVSQNFSIINEQLLVQNSSCLAIALSLSDSVATLANSSTSSRAMLLAHVHDTAYAVSSLNSSFISSMSTMEATVGANLSSLHDTAFSAIERVNLTLGQWASDVNSSSSAAVAALNTSILSRVDSLSSQLLQVDGNLTSFTRSMENITSSLSTEMQHLMNSSEELKVLQLRELEETQRNFSVSLEVAFGNCTAVAARSQSMLEAAVNQTNSEVAKLSSNLTLELSSIRSMNAEKLELLNSTMLLLLMNVTEGMESKLRQYYADAVAESNTVSNHLNDTVERLHSESLDQLQVAQEQWNVEITNITNLFFDNDLRIESVVAHLQESLTITAQNHSSRISTMNETVHNLLLETNNSFAIQLELLVEKVETEKLHFKNGLLELETGISDTRAYADKRYDELVTKTSRDIQQLNTSLFEEIVTSTDAITAALAQANESAQSQLVDTKLSISKVSSRIDDVDARHNASNSQLSSDMKANISTLNSTVVKILAKAQQQQRLEMNQTLVRVATDMSQVEAVLMKEMGSMHSVVEEHALSFNLKINRLHNELDEQYSIHSLNYEDAMSQLAKLDRQQLQLVQSSDKQNEQLQSITATTAQLGETMKEQKQSLSGLLVSSNSTTHAISSLRADVNTLQMQYLTWSSDIRTPLELAIARLEGGLNTTAAESHRTTVEVQKLRESSTAMFANITKVGLELVRDLSILTTNTSGNLYHLQSELDSLSQSVSTQLHQLVGVDEDNKNRTHQLEIDAQVVKDFSSRTTQTIEDLDNRVSTTEKSLEKHIPFLQGQIEDLESKCAGLNKDRTAEQKRLEALITAQAQQLERAISRIDSQEQLIKELREENNKIVKNYAPIESVDHLRTLLYSLQAEALAHSTKTLDLLLQQNVNVMNAIGVKKELDR